MVTKTTSYMLKGKNYCFESPPPPAIFPCSSTGRNAVLACHVIEASPSGRQGDRRAGRWQKWRDSRPENPHLTGKPGQASPCHHDNQTPGTRLEKIVCCCWDCHVPNEDTIAGNIRLRGKPRNGGYMSGPWLLVVWEGNRLLSMTMETSWVVSDLEIPRLDVYSVSIDQYEGRITRTDSFTAEWVNKSNDAWLK